jgi:hypothetical protein
MGWRNSSNIWLWAVGESLWIVDASDDMCTNETFDFDTDVEVRWPSTGKKSSAVRDTTYWAKVHRFSGKFLDV